eukprot:SAG11_NODE_19247_length_471_cov_0.672043_1_plen_24_part_01
MGRYAGDLGSEVLPESAEQDVTVW